VGKKWCRTLLGKL